MAVIAQEMHERFALYHGDSCEALPSLPEASVHLALYSPPFADVSGALYRYSSSERDLSNSRSYEEFFEHYGEYVVKQVHRVLLPGRVSAVHCMDVPRDGANLAGGLRDFPGDLIRLHERLGFTYAARYHVWKEPLAVRNRTMAKGLAHRTVVEDSTLCDVACADYLLMFRKKGKNPVPVAHPVGLTSYAGERQVPAENLKYRGFTGKQTQNKYSHWVWRQYASAFWDDVRGSRVVPYDEPPDSEDEPHMHPLQLDVIERCVVLWTNPDEVVLTPFMGVGSEVYGALLNGRRGVGIELKPSYYRQAVKNCHAAVKEKPAEQPTLFDALPSTPAAAPSSPAGDGRRRLGHFSRRKEGGTS